MVGFIIYIIGLLLTIFAIIDIVKKNISGGCKALWIVIILLTSWLGLVFYYLFAQNNIERWCNK